jgi:hypothetical protein
MGKGLSPLQHDILAVLEEFSASEDFSQEGHVSLSAWARPRQIMQRLGRTPTPSNRAAISKALDRLCARGLVAHAQAQRVIQGHSFFYIRIADAALPTKGSKPKRPK